MSLSPMYANAQQQPIVSMRQNNIPNSLQMQQAQQISLQQQHSQQQQRMMSGQVMVNANGNCNGSMSATPLSSAPLQQRRMLDGSNLPGTLQMPMQQQINAQSKFFFFY